MHIREYVPSADRTILLLAPMMVSGEDLYNLMSPHFRGSYHIIAPIRAGTEWPDHISAQR